MLSLVVFYFLSFEFFSSENENVAVGACVDFSTDTSSSRGRVVGREARERDARR